MSDTPDARHESRVEELSSLRSAAESLRASIAAASRGLIERGALVETVALAAVAGEHVLVIGPPGTAKSEAVRRIARATGGRYFEYLLGRFTEPSEIFGPIDLRKLKEGIVETETAGMLPEAEIAFLDEIFLGSTAILNTLLSLLNERVFRRGHTRMACPLRICVGAANALPEDETLAAFADRFLVRVYVDPLPDTHLEDLLEGGWALTTEASEDTPPCASIEDIDCLAAAVRRADVTPVRPFLAHAIRRLRRAGIQFTDRRAVKVQRLMAAAAALAGREKPAESDLWPLVLAVPTQEEQTLARDVLRDLLAPSHNPALPVAAEEASLGPLARAARLVASGRALLQQRPDALESALADGQASGAEAWRLKLEGIAREIDAGFAPGVLPPDLADVRARIVEAIRPATETAQQ